MLRRASELTAYRLSAQDGEIGRGSDFYFDDEHWTVRYLVADTGTWLTGRQVLLSPWAVSHIDDQEQFIHVKLSKEQIENSPSIGEQEPVSRQYERQYHGYYGVPMYWSGPLLWGPAAYPGSVEPYVRTGELERRAEEERDSHLRSVKEITGYYFRARDGDIGHVEEFIIDSDDWAIRYLVVDTVNWWPGKKVLISPHWVTSMEWPNSLIHLDLSREAIRNAPEYNHEVSLTRDYEHALFAHYNKQPYWERRGEFAAR